MTAPASRRGFLRGLTTLPFIGGGVALIGSPSAVAEPVTADLLLGYSEWLLLERRILLMEMFPDDAEGRRYYHPSNGVTDRFHLPGWPVDWRTLPQPSTRAALVLGTVGAEWRGGRCA